jgi:hypothetical protein
MEDVDEVQPARTKAANGKETWYIVGQMNGGLVIG